MGSRGQHSGRRVEDHFAGASSTLGLLGEGAQSAAVANPKKQFKSKDIVPTRPEARTPKVVPSQPP